MHSPTQPVLELVERSFNNEFNKLKELIAITVDLMEFGNSNITEQMVATDVTMALDNLASTAMSKTDALDTLMAANKQLAEALAYRPKENEILATTRHWVTKLKQ